MTHTPQEPRTRAGRELLDWLDAYAEPSELTSRILAIEAEAAAHTHSPHGWSVEEQQEDDGSWSIVSTALPGLVVAGSDRADAWRQWPEVVELWASTANDERVTAERAVLCEECRPDIDVEVLATALDAACDYSPCAPGTHHREAAKVATEYRRLTSSEKVRPQGKERHK